MTADASPTEFVTRGVLRSELDVIRAELDVLRAELRQEMHQMESRVTRWMVATMLGGMVAAGAIAAAVAAVVGS